MVYAGAAPTGAAADQRIVPKTGRRAARERRSVDVIPFTRPIRGLGDVRNVPGRCVRAKLKMERSNFRRQAAWCGFAAGSPFMTDSLVFVGGRRKDWHYGPTPFAV